MSEPNEWETRFIAENEDLLKLLVERSRFYREQGDGNMMLMMAACLKGTADLLRGIVEQEAIVVKKELSLEDIIGKS